MPTTSGSRPHHRPRSTTFGAVVLSVALAGMLGHAAWAGGSSAATSSRILDGLVHVGSGTPSAADGELPDGVTAFDRDHPGVTRLDPDLLAALRHAAADAAADGVEIYVNSGWRSAAYQERLLEEAISRYGSREQAERWVAPPARSAHVAGEAMDVGHHDAASWLARHGARYGLCQVYDNEPWHFELRPSAVGHGCPARYADPAHDPRMQ
jgi:hypothetical protein